MVSTARKNIFVFFEGARLSYVALFRWLHPPTYVASKILMPLSQILFFTFLGIHATGRDNASFYLLGNALQLTAVSGIYGVTMSIGGERWSGTLPYIFGVPSNRLAIFLGRAFMHVIDGYLGVLFGLGWGVLLFGLDLGQAEPFALLLTILITTVSTAGMGLMLGSLSLITVNVMFVNNLVYFLLLALSGANVAVDSLPAWIQPVSQILPLTRGIESMRRVAVGEGLADVLPLLAGELLVGVIYSLIGYSIFRFFELQARRRGTLDTI